MVLLTLTSYIFIYLKIKETFDKNDNNVLFLILRHSALNFLSILIYTLIAIIYSIGISVLEIDCNYDYYLPLIVSLPTIENDGGFLNEKLIDEKSFGK